jgi:hypothetical protein
MGVQVPSKKPARLEPVVAVPVTSLQSAGEVKSPQASAEKAVETGPRQPGARRSTPRDRRSSSSK